MAAAADAKVEDTAMLLGATGNVGGQILHLLVQRPLCPMPFRIGRLDLGTIPGRSVDGTKERASMWMLWTALLVLLPIGQDHHQTTRNRGEMVMGFDQDKTAHHFLLYADGGAIDIRVKDTTDSKDRDAIRSHLPHIAMMFGSGDFDVPMLVHDTKNIPGAAVLSARKDTVKYRYGETANGGRVEIVTTDPETLTALHAFLRYQIQEHQTGDSGTVEPRR